MIVIGGMTHSMTAERSREIKSYVRDPLQVVIFLPSSRGHDRSSIRIGDPFIHQREEARRPTTNLKRVRVNHGKSLALRDKDGPQCGRPVVGLQLIAVDFGNLLLCMIRCLHQRTGIFVLQNLFCADWLEGPFDS